MISESVKHEDQIARERIPKREDVPTKYHPQQSLVMIKPLDSIAKVGSIILPEVARIQLCEGHIIEKGPKADSDFNVGDCVTWDQSSEYRMEIDGVKFVLVRDSAIIMSIPRSELEASSEPRELSS